ncbi:hypothetical protein ABZV91_14955 [Nocardia sp. NPDC004568]|uniref:hypothetical protein n=1 Tax=Nocardia sp. NPDC004568 TaxID=3154551 RepID=UPI0033A96DF3
MTDAKYKTNTESVAALVARTTEDLVELYKSLDAPDPAEMYGEFSGHLPATREDAWRAFMRERGAQPWLGKAYRPEECNGHVGHGYNRYQGPDGVIIRMNRFVWDIEPSIVDGRDTLVMHYSAFDDWGGANDLIDEVRVVAPGVYLGIYHTAAPVPGFTPGEPQADGRSAISAFILAATDMPWVGPDAA